MKRGRDSLSDSETATAGSVSASPVFYDNFSSLGEEQKFQVLVDLCSPQERLRFQEELKTHLNRDFLSLLPPEIAIQVLSYLSVDDLVSGLQVCKNWRRLISEATPVWRTAPQKIGLSEAVVSAKLPKYDGSLSALTLAAWKHRKCIASSVLKVVPLSGRVQPEWGALRDYTWAGKGIVVCCERFGDLFEIEVQLVSSTGSVTITDCFDKVVPNLAPWGQVVATENNYLLWRNRNYEGNTWVRCDLDEPGTGFDKWESSDLPQLNETVLSLVIVPNGNGNALRGFCPQHRVLVRLKDDGEGTFVCVVYQISAVDLEVCNPVQLLQVQEDHGHDTNVFSYLQFSADGKLVSFTSKSGQHHIWQLDTGAYYRVSIPPSCNPIALGHLYSIVGDENRVCVVSTYTGEVLASCSFDVLHAASFLNPSPLYPQFMEALDSTWLNDFDVNPQMHQWPVVVMDYVTGYGCMEHELRAIFGFH